MVTVLFDRSIEAMRDIIGEDDFKLTSGPEYGERSVIYTTHIGDEIWHADMALLTFQQGRYVDSVFANGRDQKPFLELLTSAERIYIADRIDSAGPGDDLRAFLPSLSVLAPGFTQVRESIRLGTPTP